LFLEVAVPISTVRSRMSRWVGDSGPGAPGNSTEGIRRVGEGAVGDPVPRTTAGLTVWEKDPKRRMILISGWSYLPGEVTDPIKYKNAYYVLRRGDRSQNFEVAKPELIVSMRNRRLYRGAEDCAKAQDRLKNWTQEIGPGARCRRT
jgi:hypothetical protein